MAEADKVKIVTKIASFDDVQKSLQEVENKLNSLIKSVNDVSEKETSETKGKSGDINITRNADGTYGLETCTNEGWKKMYVSNKTTTEGISEVYLGDKPKIATKLSTTESFTSSVDSRYLPSTPDYDSGWVTWDFSEYTVGADNPLTLTHSLGALPTAVTVLFAPGQATGSVTWWSPLPSYLDSGYNHGIIYKVTSTQILLLNGDVQTYVSSDFANPGAKAVYQDGSIKVLIWK